MEVIDDITIEYSRPDMFRIYPIGDCHGGSIDCAEDEITQIVAKIKADKTGYWIGMGDIVDCILKEDRRFDISGLASWVVKDNILESQREWAYKMFSPIAKKCLAFLEGNHEHLIHLRYQNDITRNICKDLGVKYGGYSCYIVPTFKRTNTEVHQVIIHAFHGAGSAQTEGARMMRLLRLVNDIQADIYLMGHLHGIESHTPNRLQYRRGKIKAVPLVATLTGAWLKSYNQPKKGESLTASYAERYGYKPSRIGCPIIRLEPDKEKFSVES